MKTYWQDKKVLITGGTSGLGKALTDRLKELGAEVAIVARTKRATNGTHFIQGDISDKNHTYRIFAEAITKLGRIDVLFNNASSLGPTPLRPLLDTECEDLLNVLETNLIGPFRLTKLVVASMILQRSGVVVNISSDAAVSSYSNWGAYSVSKAALDHLTRVFQIELSETPLRLLAIDPGDMDTPMHHAAIPDADRSKLYQPEESADLLLRQVAEEKFEPIRRSLR